MRFLTTMTPISMLTKHVFLGKQVLWQKRKFSDQMLSHKKKVNSFFKRILSSPLNINSKTEVIDLNKSFYKHFGTAIMDWFGYEV